MPLDLLTAVDEVELGGWHDMTTGARIISEDDRIVFYDVSPKELTLLTIKFGKRVKFLTRGLREIYNVAEQHNASPAAVIDSESEI